MSVLPGLVPGLGLVKGMALTLRRFFAPKATVRYPEMPADVAISDGEIRVRFHRRAHLPIVLASGLIDKPIAVPWWNGRRLRLVQ